MTLPSASRAKKAIRSRWFVLFVLIVALYLLLGAGFYVGSKRAFDKCNESGELIADFFTYSLRTEIFIWPKHLAANLSYGEIFLSACNL